MRERERELSQKKRIALYPRLVGCSNYLIFFKPYKFLKWGLMRAEECAKMVIGPNPWRIVCRARRPSYF